MRSQLAERLGVQSPQIVHLPPDVASLAAAQEAIELADAYGVADGHPLDESQRFTLQTALGERADGSWAASTVGDFEPRQNGKNDTCAARELAGLVLFGERLLIHTAHEFPTANESFLRLVAVFEAWDDLRKLVARIRYANGEQGIELRSGQRLKYRARTGGSGRGFAKADLIVYDEAQHLQSEHIAASGPARLANPNNQSWYMGSGGLGTSSSAWRLRRRALAGDGGRFAYVEHTAEALTLIDGRLDSVRPDPMDRDAWAAANPAYGSRITDESMMSLYAELGDELFARECLCVWDPEIGSYDSVIPAQAWADCGAEPAHSASGSLSYALDVSPLGHSASVAVSDGTHIEVVAHRPGMSWVPEAFADKGITEVTLDPAGPAGALVRPLTDASVTVHELSTRDAVAACAGFLNEATEKRLRYPLHPFLDALNTAVAGAVRRDSGDGGWLWSRRKSSIDITPLVACTWALWAHGQKAAPIGGLYDPNEDDFDWED